MKPTRPEDIFRAEKERAVSARNSQHARLLAEAKAAFDKLMAEGQAARKSGRPRKHPLPPLKTTSSRIPPRPPTPIVDTPKPMALPAKPAAPQVAAKPAVAKAPSPKAKAAQGASSKRPAPKRGRADSKRPATKAKPKSKRTSRR